MKLTMNNQKNNKRIAMLVACSFGFSVAFGFAPIGTTSSSALGGSIVEAASAQTASSNLVGHDKKDKKDKKKKKGKKHGKVKKPTKPQQKVKKDGRGKGQKCTAKMLSKAAARSGLSVPAYAYYIVINDASTDGTLDVIESLMEDYPSLRAVQLTRNMGKANALNAALPMTRGEIIVTLDADSMLDEHAIEWAVWHFVNFPRVGAVTGNPRVRNRTTLLAKIQTAEYASVISLIKRTQRLVGKLMTVSGVVAAWRKTAIVGAGGWDPRSVTDDIDMTWRLETRFWDIRYEPNMLCWMLVPETLRGIWRQRLRWAQGGVEVIRLHKGVWTDWRERRIWPIYVEYVMGILWSYAFLAYLLLWVMSQLTGVGREIVGNPFWGWNGAVIACVCLLQFVISVLLDMRYDEDLWKVIFWVVWYPVVYWAFNAMAAAVSFPKGLFRSMKQPATWVSPDRGVR